MEKFTKGPWAILPLEDDKEYIRIRGTALGGRYKIADVHDLHFAVNSESAWVAAEREESKANAALIACAPEMYEMLKALKAQITDTNADADVSHIDALLAKARGES